MAERKDVRTVCSVGIEDVPSVTIVGLPDNPRLSISFHQRDNEGNLHYADTIEVPVSTKSINERIRPLVERGLYYLNVQRLGFDKREVAREFVQRMRK